MFGHAAALLFIVYAAIMVAYHVNYTASKRVLPRRLILPSLLADLFGYWWMYGWLDALGLDIPWLRVALWIHGIVHLASLGWALFHWKSLERHMDDFQNRRLSRGFFAAELVYEQSDTAIYVWLAAVLVAQQPPWLVMGLSIGMVALFQAFVQRRGR